MFQHERQLDPTQIIVIPYDLVRLGKVVGGMCMIGILIRLRWDQGYLSTYLQMCITYTVLAMVIFIVSGASPYENLGHTLLAALYLVTLTLLDLPIFNNHPTLRLDILDRLFYTHSQQPLPAKVTSSSNKNSYRSTAIQQLQQDKLAIAVAHGTVACAIPFQILLLYDRGWQVQRWPVPVLVGSTLGWALGTVVGTLWAVITVK